MSNHDILMITYNRAEYTRLTLNSLLEGCDPSMRVWVWHNGSDEKTLHEVKNLSNHPRFHHLQVSPENRELREPTNWFWANSDGSYLSKVDDDCLEVEGWGATLRAAHKNDPSLGVIGAWRFYDEDFVPELAEKKIRSLKGSHQIMENCWVQGSGYVMKRECQEEIGFLRENESFPAFCLRSALAGWLNGWYFPFLHEEHMDDPRSPYCGIKTDREFMDQRPLSAIKDNVTTLAQWAARVKHMARVVQEAPTDPRMHVGWRARVRSVKRRIAKLAGQRDGWRRASG